MKCRPAMGGAFICSWRAGIRCRVHLLSAVKYWAHSLLAAEGQKRVRRELTQPADVE